MLFWGKGDALCQRRSNSGTKMCIRVDISALAFALAGAFLLFSSRSPTLQINPAE